MHFIVFNCLFNVFILYILLLLSFIFINSYAKNFILTFKLDNDRSSVETSHTSTVSFYFKLFQLYLTNLWYSTFYTIHASIN